MNNATPQTADIIIIGAGIVGAALACALASLNLQIIVIDGKAPGANDLLVSAVTYDCQQWLNQLGAWNNLPKEQLGIFCTMKIWEQTSKDRSAELNFDSAYLGTPTLGYIITNHLLQAALLKKLTEYSNVKILQPAQPQDVQFFHDSVVVTVKDQPIKAKLLVGADGANSWVRKQCHFSLTEQTYEHSALITNIQIEHPHQQCAYQRFHDKNILGILPLADPHQCGLVWSGEPEYINKLTSLTEEKFNQELQKTLGDSLGTIKAITQKRTLPLTMRHALQYVQDRVALIGDAAHTIHPLAGQGLNLGLWDAEQLANAIQQTLNKKRDIGLYNNLRPFERARRGHNQLMLNIVASNKWLFTNPNTTMSELRQTGIRILEKCSSLKQKIMQIAVSGEIF